MSKRRISIGLLAVTAHFVCILGADAATRNAASCSSADVQSAINAAVAGDTVAVPAGNCTWTTKVTISNKALTLNGAGIGATNITDGIGGALDVDGASSANFVTVGGFTFIKSANNSGRAVIEITGGQDTVG